MFFPTLSTLLDSFIHSMQLTQLINNQIFLQIDLPDTQVGYNLANIFNMNCVIGYCMMHAEEEHVLCYM